MIIYEIDMLAKKLVISLMILITLPCFAEDLPGLSQIQNTKLQDNILMLDIIRATSIGSKDPISIIEKELPVYESLVELTCMPHLTQTFEYTDYDPETPEGKECAKYIEKLEEILPSDPVLICAKNGINSSICKEGYEAQYIGTFNPDEYDKEAIDVKAKMNLEMSQTEIEKLENSINKNSDKIHDYEKTIEELKKASPVDTDKIEELQKEQDEKNMELEDQYNKLVNLQCSISDITVVTNNAPDSTMLIKQQNSKKTTSKLEKLILKLEEDSTSSKDNSSDKKEEDEYHYVEPFSNIEEATPTPTAIPIPKFWRVRRITSQCSSAIEKGLEYSPNLYAAICQKYGLTSPHCIQSMKQYKIKRLKALKASDVIPHTDGLATF